MPLPVKGFFEIYEDMVQILLVLEVLFTQDSGVKICSVVLLPARVRICVDYKKKLNEST